MKGPKGDKGEDGVGSSKLKDATVTDGTLVITKERRLRSKSTGSKNVLAFYSLMHSARLKLVMSLLRHARKKRKKRNLLLVNLLTNQLLRRQST